MSRIPVEVPTGAIRYNTDSNKMECFNGTKWYQISVSESTPIAGRAVVMGGQVDAAPTFSNIIQYVTIETRGNSIDFGDLTVARYYGGATGSRTRGVYGGGRTPTKLNTMEYITIATAGNAIDFGDLLNDFIDDPGSFGNQVRGVIAGGSITGDDPTNSMEYWTMAILSNAIDFGDLTVKRRFTTGVASPTRGLVAGGMPHTNVIDYVTIMTTGNAVDFGDLTRAHMSVEGVSSGIRGVFGQGRTYPPTDFNTIDYVDIATLGNAVDWGDMVYTGGYGQAAGSKTRGLWLGGTFPAPTGNVNIIQELTLLTLGNSTDFGDLSTGTQYSAACSNAHGGL
jgi:hypothetical protein